MGRLRGTVYDVLILVLVEIGLGDCGRRSEGRIDPVLILVLVEIGLGVGKVGYCYTL